MTKTQTQTQIFSLKQIRTKHREDENPNFFLNTEHSRCQIFV